jgi:hypothetical protein
MKINAVRVLVTVAAGVFVCWRLQTPRTTSAQTPADLYIKDTPSDTGVEPNPDTGPMWISEDIWVRTTPDPNYQPYPFPEATPTWIPAPHENPEYRDPKYSHPNYVYVRIHNRGGVASTGTERLKVYWAKGSTGLSWPTQWVDYLATTCGPNQLYGAEITKERKNAATATAAERAAYRQAILDIATTPAFTFDISYWNKQQQVHRLGPTMRHGTPAFLPWHREFVNRYEILLQAANPTVKLLYWDWTTDPETGGFNFFTSAFMGASGRGTGGVGMGAPLTPALNPADPPPTVTRNLSAGPPGSQADGTILSQANYPGFRTTVEGVPNHNSAHGYIGGSGDMSFISQSTRDPFFFLLHAKVDELWARWQRAALARVASSTTYGSQSGDANIIASMAPWDGTGTPIEPWTAMGGYIVSKTSLDESIVSPPLYDTAPLTIPVLQPGEAVVMEIPWYPPNPANFACFSDQGHFCLLSRIETSKTAPFGMTTPEGTDVNANTRNNNNIAWKNIAVVDNFPGAFKISSVLIRNIFREPVNASLHLSTNTDRFGSSFFDLGTILVDLKPELFRRWRAGGGQAREVETAGQTAVRVSSPNAVMENIRLAPGESFSVDVRFELRKDYTLPRGTRPRWDLIQTGAPGNPNAVVGGMRFEVDVDKIALVKERGDWRYLETVAAPPAGWTGLNFDDSKWKTGKAEFGFGNEAETMIDGGPPGRRWITTYFRTTLDVADPSFLRSLLMRLKRSDGAVVYLNGVEVHRANLPQGAIANTTLATRGVKGIETRTFFPIPVGLERLRAGRNVVAVEIHRNSANSDDISFDLELAANRSFTQFPPSVGFASIRDGRLWPAGRAMPVSIDALDPDGQVKSVSLFADGKQVAIAEKPPFTFQWTPTRGVHRLRAVAVDNDQQRSTAEVTVTGVANVPPTVSLNEPRDGSTFKVGDAVAATAQAADMDGSVSSVEFYLHEGDLFATPARLVQAVKKAPFRISMKNLKAGHYMLTAVAKDNRGESGFSIPVHFEVGDHTGH